jgi:hypothetical protein
LKSHVFLPDRIFVFVSFLLNLTVTLYGWATIWKMGWITRTAKEARVVVPQKTEPLETVPG